MKPDFLNYKDYKAIDFFQDELFLAYVQKNTSFVDSYWEELGMTYPHLEKEIILARDWAWVIKRQATQTSAKTSDVLWEQIMMDIPAYSTKQDRIVNLRKWGKIAAGIAAVWMLLFLYFEVRQLGTHEMNTAYGQRKNISLPDESFVSLNSNSQLSYVRDWKTDKPREVWLEGEALFDVKHTAIRNRINQSDYFVVRVADLKLTVLGTKFNVKQRRNRVTVSLFEGSVQIDEAGGNKHMLVPGETFYYDLKRQEGEKIQKDTEKVLAWTKNELDVEHFNLEDVIEILEDNYGYQVDLKDSSLLEKRLMGTIPTQSAQDILFVIRHTMDLKITQRNKNLTIDHLTK